MMFICIYVFIKRKRHVLELSVPQSFVGMAMTTVKAVVTTDMNSQLPSLSALVFFKVIFADFGSSFVFLLCLVLSLTVIVSCRQTIVYL